MKLSKLEQETIILWNEAEASAEVYTYNPALLRQLAELRKTCPDQVRVTQENAHGGMTYQIPKKWLKVSPPRVLSPAQREVLVRMNEKRHERK